jgi:HSP20 family protein
MRSLVTYRPYSLWNEMDRAFGRFFEDRSTTNGVAVDIREEEHGYVVEADLPGMTEKDIDVKVENDILTLSSVHEESKEEERNGYLMRERRSAKFRRSFYLPKDVDREKIEAKLENGLLTVHLHKSEAAKPRQIEVKKA